MLGTASNALTIASLQHALAIAAMPYVATAPWIALCTTMPDAFTAGVEVNQPGYARRQAVFYRPLMPTNIIRNRDDIEFAAATVDWGDLVALEIWNAGPSRGSGARLFYTPLVDPAGNTITQRVVYGDLVIIAADTIVLSGI